MAADESSQDTLRLQFQAMQQMQHKRLQKQMERKREKELSPTSRADGQEEPLEVPGGLSLLHAGEPHSKSSFEKRVLEDEIEHLRNELREKVDENGRLYKLLKERDFEIKHLRKNIDEDRLAFTVQGLQTGQTARSVPMRCQGSIVVKLVQMSPGSDGE
ncbi:Coiled-coil domain-containing protein 13, partial [Saguinus oedipus]